MDSGVLIRDLPQGERPRERLRALGADALRNAELIAILLRTGTKGVSAVQIAERLMARFGTLDALAGAPLDQLCETKGVGPDKAIALKSAFTLARRMARELHGEAPLLDTPERVAAYLREDNRHCDVERFQVLMLNARQRLIRHDLVSQGILDQALAHPREVFRLALLANAHSIVLAHNHPSGDPMPSEADIKMTRDLVRAGQIMRIPVFDHIILGRRNEASGRDFVSLRELGHVI